MKLIECLVGCIAIACAPLTNADSSITFDEIYNILQPLEDQFEQNSTDFDDVLTEGADGYIAFNINPKREIKTLSYPTLPKTLPSEFFITTVLKPDPAQGFVFAVLDPTETIIQLAVELVPAGPDVTNVALLYTNATAHTSSQTIASLPAFHLARQWTNIFITAENEEVSLYINCTKVSSERVQRRPAELAFNEDSVLRLGRAGPLDGSFQVETAVTVSAPTTSGGLSVLEIASIISIVLFAVLLLYMCYEKVRALVAGRIRKELARRQQGLSQISVHSHQPPQYATA